MSLPAYQIAQVCHEANRTLQVIQNDPAIPISPHWEELDLETRESAIDGVRNVQGGASPRESHANWVRFKTDHGWTWGPVKNLATKEHPLLVPYDELPGHQVVKDAMFVAIVRTLS